MAVAYALVPPLAPRRLPTAETLAQLVDNLVTGQQTASQGCKGACPPNRDQIIDRLRNGNVVLAFDPETATSRLVELHALGTIL